MNEWITQNEWWIEEEEEKREEGTTNNNNNSVAKTFPLLYFLSGLTCTEDNFITKSGALKKLSSLGIALICPDTSPRGLGIPGEDTDWDFGTGAGFYVDATESPFENYKMYSYVTQELPRLIQFNFPNQLDSKRVSICGHSMVIYK